MINIPNKSHLLGGFGGEGVFHCEELFREFILHACFSNNMESFSEVDLLIIIFHHYYIFFSVELLYSQDVWNSGFNK